MIHVIVGHQNALGMCAFESFQNCVCLSRGINDSTHACCEAGYNIGIGFQPKRILSGKLFIEFKYGSSFSKLMESGSLEMKFNKLQFNIGCYIN